jgi:hypothetical protein
MAERPKPQTSPTTAADTVAPAPISTPPVAAEQPKTVKAYIIERCPKGYRVRTVLVSGTSCVDHDVTGAKAYFSAVNYVRTEMLRDRGKQ